jgi:hypothetical protein
MLSLFDNELSVMVSYLPSRPDRTSAVRPEHYGPRVHCVTTACCRPFHRIFWFYNVLGLS